MRASDYPIPDYAAYIWHRGDAIGVMLPDYNGNGHSLFIPIDKFLDNKGARFLVDLLCARHSEYIKRGHSDLGTNAEPTSQMLEHAMRIAKANPGLYTSTPIDIFAEAEHHEK